MIEESDFKREVYYSSHDYTDELEYKKITEYSKRKINKVEKFLKNDKYFGAHEEIPIPWLPYNNEVKKAYSKGLSSYKFKDYYFAWLIYDIEYILKGELPLPKVIIEDILKLYK